MKCALRNLKCDTVRIPLFILLCCILTLVSILLFDEVDLTARIVIMAMPTFAVLLTRNITGEKGSDEVFYGFCGKLRYYIAGYYLPIAAIALGTLIYYLLFPAHFDPNMGAQTKQQIEDYLAHAEWAYYYGLYFIPAIFDMGLLYLGDSFGWQGYLLPKLIKQFKILPATIILGIAWSIPEFIRLAFFQGDALLQDMGGLLILVESPGDGNSFLYLLLMIMLLFLPMSVFVTRLTIKTRSFIPALLGQTAYMRYYGLWGTFLAVGVKDHPLYFFITWGPMIALSVFSMLQMMKEEREGRLLPPEPEPEELSKDVALENQPS